MKKEKVKKLGIVVGVMMVSLCLIFLTSPQHLWAAGKVTLKCGYGVGVKHSVHEMSLRISKRAAELSNGTLNIECYPAAQLGTEEQLIEQMQLKSVEMMPDLSHAKFASILPWWGFGSLPFLFASLEEYGKVWNTPLGGEMEKRLLAKGFRRLGWMQYGIRSVLCVKPVKSMADLKGVKIRVMANPDLIKAWKLVGASPVPMAWAEVYSALQAKVIDAMESPPSSVYYAAKAHEVAKNYTMTRHQITAATVVIAEWAWKKLTPVQQRALITAVNEGTTWQREYNNTENVEAIKLMKQAGVKIYEIDRKPFRDAVLPVHNDFTNRIGWKSILKEIKAVTD